MRARLLTLACLLLRALPLRTLACRPPLALRARTLACLLLRMQAFLLPLVQLLTRGFLRLRMRAFRLLLTLRALLPCPAILQAFPLHLPSNFNKNQKKIKSGALIHQGPFLFEYCQNSSAAPNPLKALNAGEFDKKR